MATEPDLCGGGDGTQFGVCCHKLAAVADG
jgi:hypothetical protein